MENHRLVIESKAELSTSNDSQELFILKMRIAKGLEAKQLEQIYHSMSRIAAVALEGDIQL